MNSSGMKWVDLNDPKNGMRSVLTIMVLEWFLFLSLAFYLDHFGSFQNGIRKAAVLFHSRVDKNRFQATQHNIQLQEFKASADNEKTDVIKEVCSFVLYIPVMSKEKAGYERKDIHIKQG